MSRVASIVGCKMFHCHIDHIVVTAPTLERGAEFVIGSLGVEPQVGGKHLRMGTHNLVLRLGDSSYLEIISAVPDAPKPQRARWFSLDGQKPDSEPRLAAWVARTNNIEAICSGIPEPLGEIEAMTRGALHWRITVPVDGSRPLGGVAPALVEWQTSTHPALTMKSTGCALIRLEGFHPDATRVSNLLGWLGLRQDVHVSPLLPSQEPYLVAHISTPKGMRTIGAANKTLAQRHGQS